MIIKIHHTGIIVSNIGKLLPFYKDIIGMELKADLGLQDGPEVPMIMGVPDAKVTIVMLQMGGQTFELIQLINPTSTPALLDQPYGQVGHSHIAFQVDDIQAAYNKLKQNGVKLVLPPQQIPGVMKFFYVRDPEGNMVEMVQSIEIADKVSENSQRNHR